MVLFTVSYRKEIEMNQTAKQRPPMAGFHHFGATVTDVEASADWYQRVLGLERIPVEFPHYGNEDTGYTVLLTDLSCGIVIGVHRNIRNDGQPFDEARTGLDHISISVPSRPDLESWAEWLESLAVLHSGVTDIDNPLKYSALVFRDPDNIQLELFFMAG
jgi:catechol 2,3-dioxygenase-like lactoylglutathione lyase family enzyme